MKSDDDELARLFYWSEDDGDNVNQFLTTLIAVGALEGAALGVTRQCIAQGVDTLTDKQFAVFDRAIKEFITRACQRCGNEIAWSEMYDAYLNRGFCAYWDILPGMNAGASTSAVPSPIEGSGTAWVLLGSWALSPARPTPIHPRPERRGFSALLVKTYQTATGQYCREYTQTITIGGEKHKPLM